MNPRTHDDFAIGLRAGIFDQRHFRAIGIALWTFAWCVRRQTDKNGWVLGGEVLTYPQVAREAGLETRRQADSQISRLVRGGYLERHTVPGGGFKLRISAPKKVFRAGVHPPGEGHGEVHPPGEGTFTPQVKGFTVQVKPPKPPNKEKTQKTQKTGEASMPREASDGTTGGPPTPLPPPKPSVWEKTPPSPESEWVERAVEAIRVAADKAGIATTVGGWLAGEDGWVKYPKRRARLLSLRGVVRAEDWGPWMDLVARKVEAAVASGTTYNGDWALELLIQTVDVKWKRPQESN